MTLYYNRPIITFYVIAYLWFTKGWAWAIILFSFLHANKWRCFIPQFTAESILPTTPYDRRKSLRTTYLGCILRMATAQIRSDGRELTGCWYTARVLWMGVAKCACLRRALASDAIETIRAIITSFLTKHQQSVRAYGFI